MNDKAREALVAAALSGVKQIKFALQDSDGGRCANGVLMEACTGVAPHQINWTTFNPSRFWEWGGLSLKEEDEIVHANNVLGWDFLTIARKIGVNDEG